MNDDANHAPTTRRRLLGTVVPDVTRSAQFFSRVFNPELYKERDEPLRYYVTLVPVDPARIWGLA